MAGFGLPKASNGALRTIATAGILVLAACQSPPPPERPAVQLPDPIPVEPELEEEEVVLGPPPLPAPKPVLPPDELDDPPPELSAIVGYDQPSVRRLLGEPQAIEDRPPAQSWAYSTETCTLTVYFFMELSRQDFRALSYEITTTEDRDDAYDRCFDELVARAAAGV